MQNYELLAKQVEALVEDAPTVVAALANVSALLWETIEDINWCGFYISDGHGKLHLGPFQGKVACYSIDFGKGVCGVAAQNKSTQVVEDVHTFSGHIACDSASNSEVVVPLIVDDEVVAVLDIDSPTLARFSKEDGAGLEKIAGILVQHFA